LAQLESIAADLIEQRKNTTNLTEEEALKVRVWIASQKQLVAMQQTLNETTIPALHKGHQDDALTMNVTILAFQYCDLDRDSDVEKAQAMKRAVMEKKDNNTCQQELSDLISQNRSNWESIEKVVDAVHLKPRPLDILAFDGWFAEAIDAFETYDSLYVEKEQTVNAGQEAFSEKKDECIDDDAHYKKSFCAWKRFATEVSTEYGECWAEKSKTFDAIKPAVSDAVDRRKSDFKSIQTILCYIEVIERLGPSNATTAELWQEITACKAKEVDVDTDWLDDIPMDKPVSSLPDIMGTPSPADPHCDNTSNTSEVFS